MNDRKAPAFSINQAEAEDAKTSSANVPHLVSHLTASQSPIDKNRRLRVTVNWSYRYFRSH